MGYGLGYDSTHQRDVGYGVPAICEHPDCKEEIDRGMGHACGGSLPEDGCGRYLCPMHGVVDIARNGIDKVIRLKAQAKQDEALIRQLV